MKLFAAIPLFFATTANFFALSLVEGKSEELTLDKAVRMGVKIEKTEWISSTFFMFSLNFDEFKLCQVDTLIVEKLINSEIIELAVPAQKIGSGYEFYAKDLEPKDIKLLAVCSDRFYVYEIYLK